MIKRCVFLLALLAASPGLAQSPPASHSRAEIVAAAQDIMQKAHYVTLVTVAPDGQPQARIVDPLPPDAGFTIWMSTNPLSRKVDQLRRNDRVTLLFYDASTASYVSLLGRGMLVSDPAEKEKHWKKDWNRIYPNGPRSGDVVLIRFTPSRLEIVSDARRLTGDTKTWQPLAIALP